MQLANESLRPRLKPAVQQTQRITMTKVCGRMQCDEGMVKMKKTLAVFTHSRWGSDDGSPKHLSFHDVVGHACAS